MSDKNDLLLQSIIDTNKSNTEAMNNLSNELKELTTNMKYMIETTKDNKTEIKDIQKDLDNMRPVVETARKNQKIWTGVQAKILGTIILIAVLFAGTAAVEKLTGKEEVTKNVD